jgi:hypothetical protein
MAASLTSIILPAFVPTKMLERITQQCLESLDQTTPPDSYEREVGYFDESLAYRFHDQDLG